MSKYIITLNGRSYEIEVQAVKEGDMPETAADACKEVKPSAGKPVVSSTASDNGGVNAPMPGTVLKVNKSVGDRVEAGEAVIILEAMKMENDINSPISGTIKSISVNKGDSVSAGQFLFEVA